MSRAVFDQGVSLVYASLVGKPRKPRFGLSFILCHRRNYRNKTLFVECSAFNCSGFFYNLLFLYVCSHPKNYRNCNYTKLFTQTVRKCPGTNNPHFFFSFGDCPVFTRAFYHLFSIILRLYYMTFWTSF